MDSVNPDPQNIPDDDLRLQNYQDDLDTNSAIADPIMDEGSDDPTEELGVDPKEFKKELDQYAFEDGLKNDDTRDPDETKDGDPDDRREDIENSDMDDGDSTKH